MNTLVVPEHLKPYAEEMLADLELFQLQVGLIPATDCKYSEFQCLRAVKNKNPEWYRDLCLMYPRSRRKRKEKYTDSKIKRSWVILTLERMLVSGSSSQIAPVLLAVMEQKFCNDQIPF